MSEERKNEGLQKIANAIEIDEVARTLSFDLETSLDALLLSASRALNADGASVIVRDNENGDLIFFKAVGTVSDQLEGLEIPAGKGIAGFVAMSGQPMAISDVGSEESFYAEIDKKTGFSTEILLATPLFFDGDIIGVLEFINRSGEPPFEPFTPEEMDQAAVYGESLGALVNALRASRLSGELATKLCGSEEEVDFEEIRGFIADLKAKPGHREMLEIAVLVKKISEKGEAHRALCREILEAMQRFTENSGQIDYSDV
ncbi:MAG: GAF domain-containing protein [Pyrinomonadaceae bacterium]|nr:GAF domain-containing protein [Pyrinomonadaceae bacterium]